MTHLAKRRRVSAAAARAVLDEIQAISVFEASEDLPLNQNAFARLVLFRLIQQLDARLPEAERGKVHVRPYPTHDHEMGRIG